jgi:hypothetical protein
MMATKDVVPTGKYARTAEFTATICDFASSLGCGQSGFRKPAWALRRHIALAADLASAVLVAQLVVAQLALAVVHPEQACAPRDRTTT